MIAFSALHGDPPQAFQNLNDYNLVRWSDIEYDHGCRFQDNTWIPVEDGETPGIVVFSGRLWILAATSQTPGVNPNFTVRLVKNGDPMTGETFVAHCACDDLFSNVANVTISAQDYAEPGDEYRMYIYVTHLGAQIDNHPLGHSCWMGALTR